MKDTESEIDKCIAAISGIKVSDLYQGSPTFDNADYWFKKYNVIAELKCLIEDKGQDRKINEKIQNIFDKHLYVKKPKIVAFGTNTINSSDISKQCEKDVAEVYRRPLQGVMKKANKQIRETKVNLKVEDAHGLLIIINDKNTALDPSHAIWLIRETLRRDGLRSINSVLYITLNLLASHPKINHDITVWIELFRDKENICPQELYNLLRITIHERWENITGEPISPLMVNKHEDLHEIDN